MSELKNITLKEYIELSEKDKSVYDLVLNSIIPTKDIHLKICSRFVPIKPKHYDLWDFMYSDIIELKMALAELKDFELTAEIARIVYGISKPEKVFDISILNVAAGFSWVVAELMKIIELERSELNYELDEKEKAAGVEELARFGHFPTIDGLTGGDITRQNKILKQPYHKVFEKLVFMSTVNKINKKMIQYVSK